MQRYWLVCYDIRDDKRLRRVARLMEGFGLRAQKSVFECWLDDRQLAELKELVSKIIDSQVDDIRYYSLCATCRELSTKKTSTEIRENRKYFIV